MNAGTLTVTEVVRHFSDYISRVAYRNESFILSKGNKPVAELRPVSAGRRLGDLPSILKSLPHLSDEEASEFAEDIEVARTSVKHDDTLRDPWAF
ncbi:MAG: antitoxin [Spartobacteria bacterium]|nr:antitoxin [Spartobacteria bacterium]